MKIINSVVFVAFLGSCMGILIGYLITDKSHLIMTTSGTPKNIRSEDKKSVRFITNIGKVEDLHMELSKTAVIVIDMQNSFASKGGMLDYLRKFSDKNRVIIQPIQNVLKATRTARIKTIFLRMLYRSDLSNGGGTQSPNYWKELGIVAMREKPQFKGKFITEGTWDSEIIEELKPFPGDIVVNKSRYSGFVNNELQTILQTYNIKYLIFVGLATNVCVESTIRDAFFHEYFPILVSDCVAPVGPDYLQDATVFNVQNFFGWVTTSDSLIKFIRETRK